MKIYNYDDNGIFIGESIADESPLETGVFLIPAFSTTEKPLEHKDGFYIKFNSELNEFQYEEKPIEVKEADKELSEEEIEAQLQEQANAEAWSKLNEFDWKVIRELERLMLAGTDLNLEREALRESIVW